MLSFTDDEIKAEAVRLGLITNADDLPRHLRSQVVASLAARTTTDTADSPGAAVPGGELTVTADGDVLLDGRPFPLPVTTDPIEVTARHGGRTTVRLTVVVDACHLHTGAPAAPDA